MTLILLVLTLHTGASCALPEEVHGVWSGWGKYAGAWSGTAAMLDSLSVNLLMPNFLYGCSAAFETGLVPPSDLFEESGDCVTECMEACGSRGIQVHAWAVLWKMNLCDSVFVDSMRQAGRVQVSSTGEYGGWLCPTDPRNRELMLSLLRELVTEYSPDGIQLDYIRFPGSSFCFCSGCRGRFGEDTGIMLRGWPDQVLEGGRYHDEFAEWRVSKITGFVREVHDMLASDAPGVMLSAAVLPDRSDAARNGQDWATWAEDGLVDFLVPMDYTDSTEVFEGFLDEQFRVLDGFPVVIGIGVFAAGLDLTPDQTLLQTEAALDAGAAGWALFHLNDELLHGRLPAVASP